MGLPLSAITRKHIREALDGVSIAAVRSWLRAQGFAHAASTRAQLIERLYRLIAGNELSEQAFAGVLANIEEASAKRVYLYAIGDPIATVCRRQAGGTADSQPELSAPREPFEKRARRLGFTLNGLPRVAPRLPIAPALVYMTKTGPVVRAKWAETHERVEPDYIRQRFFREKVTRVIVLLADLNQKLAELRFDKPETFHSHRDRNDRPDDELYFAHYANLAAQVLGAPLIGMDLREALRSLIETEPRVVRVESNDFRTGSNSRVRFSSRRDIRDDLDWRAMHETGGGAWAYDREFVHWLPEASAGKLSREVFTDINSRTGKLRVEADCHEEELAYAISTIRAHHGHQIHQGDRGKASKAAGRS